MLWINGCVPLQNHISDGRQIRSADLKFGIHRHNQAVDSIREKKSKVVIALCPSIVQPADVPAQMIIAQGMSMAPYFKFPFQ